jgi:hypothetical protein
MNKQAANTNQNTAKGKKKLPAALEANLWQPGQSGNPSGRPKKKAITEMYERILNDPEHIKAIELATVKALRAGNMAMVLQLREMADRTEGKVTQPIEADISVNLADAIALARKRASK